jgi:tetratricopeptide (TPR) repeat protein/sugar lactone lactonase YvrE
MKLEVVPVKTCNRRLAITLFFLAIVLSCTGKPKKKIDMYRPPEQERPVLVAGFHGLALDKSRVWENFALSYFVAEELRLSGPGKTWLDPIVLRNFFPAFDTRLFAKMPANDDLVYMCNLFRCEKGFYIVWEDLPTGEREYRVYPFGGSGVEPIKTRALPRDDLVGGQRFIAQTVSDGLKMGSGLPRESEGFIPRNPLAIQRATMGLYFSDTGWYNKALAYFKSALRADPGYSYANLKVGEIYLAKDEAGEALKHLLAVHSQFSDDPYYLYLLARGYFYSGNSAEAETTVDEALKVAPEYQEALMLQTIIKGQTGKKGAERSALGRFLQSNPRTGAQLARAEKYISAFGRSPEATVLSNKLVLLQVYDPFFGELPSELFNRIRFVGEWTLGRLQRDIRHPVEILATPLGILVWDQTARAVLHLNSDGITKKEFTHPGLIEVDGMAFQPPNRLYLADPLAGTVFAMNLTDGEVTVVTKEIARPRGVAVLSGHLFVTDAVNDVIWVLSLNGSVLKKLDIPRRGLNKEASPRRIVPTPKGTLLYEDDLFNRIMEITPEGRILGSVASFGLGPDEIVEPVGLARAPDGRVFVTDWGDHRIKVFNPDGSAFAVFGGYGTLSGQFNRPAGIAFLADGRFLVTDRENGRIQIFRMDSRPPDRKRD